MIKYIAAAGALKAFSFSPLTIKAYRFLGNTVGDRIRSKAGLPKIYIDRARWIIKLFEQYQISHQDAQLLEIGTGWVHWESTILRLFYNARFSLYDVCDNRHFNSFKTYFSGFRDVFDFETENLPLKFEEARDLLEEVVSVSSFEQLYDLLGVRYLVDPTGTLLNLEPGTFDACFSYNVLEHVDMESISTYIKNLHHLLKPGGYSIQSIDISDHFVQYDRGVSKKNYLRYSDAVWKLFFENKVQYINRIQRGEWLNLFSQAGFRLEEEDSHYEPIHTIVDKKYRSMDQKDIECITLKIVHRKP